ncbi:MAG: response regulator, partial [Bacteroidota bacterium]|nr:response regulator [Bacteroidota bacterium]
MVRLFIIEDHLTVIVSSLRFLFRPQRDDIKVVGYSADPEDIVKNADPSGFDLFVLDLHIPGLQPIDNIRKLKKHFPDKPVVIFTNDKSSSWKAKMLQEG